LEAFATNIDAAKENSQSMRQPAVYIMASRRNGTLYTEVTSHLSQRVFQHKEGHIPGFTARHGCKMLVYYELYEDMIAAIAREKQIKGGSRRDKLLRIDRFNPEWRDLYADFA
jgi:putative endonuclease